MENGTRSRGNNIEKGRAGEDACAKEYEKRGCSVIARNWRKGKIGEIDLIVLDESGRTLCFCEVKTRKSSRFAQAGAAVDYRKRMKYRLLADLFLRERPEFACRYVRFDVAEVYYGTDPAKLRVELAEGAF
ncbi:MAG: YraN family protein [Clostridia bacterium]|nr:YraN family protein [Clostridia bacterium]